MKHEAKALGVQVSPGLSFLVCCGPYGGFSFWHRTNGLKYTRICLGWVSLAVYRFDYEDFVTCLISEAKA